MKSIFKQKIVFLEPYRSANTPEYKYEKAKQVCDKIISNNCECTIVPMDIKEDQALNNLAKTIAEKNNKIDIIVSCAGVIDQLSPVDSINEIEFKNIVETNYIANFILIKSFHYLLKNSKNGRLVILSTNQNDDGQYWGVYRPIMKALNALVITYANENKKSSC